MSRLQFVIGKGGVGRSTVAAGLAVAAGATGRRALVVELNGMADIGRRHGLERSYEPVMIAPGTDWRSLTPRDCVIDFGRRQLKLGAMSTRLLGSRRLQRFLDAIPGLPDLLQLGKIENLLNEPASGETVYDLVVVDCPATGHGLTLLDAPTTMTEVSRAGPFHDLAENIANALTDGTAGIVVTTLPERLPFSETLELLQGIAERPVPLDEVVLNRVLPPPVPDVARWPQVRAALDTPHLVELTDGLIAAYRDQLHVESALREIVDVPLRKVPSTGLSADAGRVAAALVPA